VSAVKLHASPDGVALESLGFVFNIAYAISPLGVLTRGFVVGAGDFWQDAETVVSTVWTNVDPL
jgi:hypothetical protein